MVVVVVANTKTTASSAAIHGRSLEHAHCSRKKCCELVHYARGRQSRRLHTVHVTKHGLLVSPYSAEIITTIIIITIGSGNREQSPEVTLITAFHSDKRFVLMYQRRAGTRNPNNSTHLRNLDLHREQSIRSQVLHKVACHDACAAIRTRARAAPTDSNGTLVSDRYPSRGCLALNRRPQVVQGDFSAHSVDVQ